MRKVFVAACSVVLLLSMAGVGLASETDWLWSFRASTSEYTNGSAAAHVGTMETPTLTAWTNSAGTGAGLALYSPAYTGYKNNYAILDARLPLDPNDEPWASYTWEARMWLNTYYERSSLVLSFWNMAVKDMPVNISGVGYTYTINMISDPTGTFPAGQTWAFDTAAPNTSSTSPLLQLTFGNFEGLKMMPDAAVNDGVKFSLTARPIPEPGCMLAFASGLAGMAGYAIRRRRGC